MARVTKFTFTVILFLVFNVSHADLEFDRQNVLLNSQIFDLEIADTPERKKQGLMYRTALGKKQGMLFIYPYEGWYRIWMKNTLIPLAVFWIDASNTIIHKQLLQPCKTRHCSVYQATAPSLYILELHASRYPEFDVGDSLPGLQVFKPR